jgi:polyketide synthase 3/4
LFQVLVHAGTGGVGVAAVSVAGALGCAVCTTAGSSFKRVFLRASGVRGVASSRDASFTDPFFCSPYAGTL